VAEKLGIAEILEMDKQRQYRRPKYFTWAGTVAEARLLLDQAVKIEDEAQRAQDEEATRQQQLAEELEAIQELIQQPPGDEEKKAEPKKAKNPPSKANPGNATIKRKPTVLS